MKCPECQTENPDSRKFCRECGEKLLLICPKCKTENLPGDKFCGECGHNLTIPSDPAPKALTPEEKIEKIQKYLPKGIAENQHSGTATGQLRWTISDPRQTRHDNW